MKDISINDLLKAKIKYHDILNSLGKQYLYGAPSIQRFLSPANYSLFPKEINWSVMNEQTWTLSITGEKRYEMLFSPHARTLVAAILARTDA